MQSTYCTNTAKHKVTDMSERPVKRLRRLSTEEDDTSGNDDWIPDELKNKAGGIGYGKYVSVMRFPKIT